ncbi:MAG: hypothetical protein NWF05_11960 [Candidatus Bathyarchaeota archaeon]|nr:hypothetical protein [Candidatus Bathyarchaeota archaeon]
MKRLAWLLITVLVVSAVILPSIYLSNVGEHPEAEEDDWFFGVTYGQNTVEAAKRLIDRVHNYTNVFVVDSFAISQNRTMLDEICSYATEKNLHFFVYFFSLYAFDWQQEWVTTANQTYGDHFLGVYLRDEPGGRQIEQSETFTNASSYSDAANKYVENLSDYWSMQFLRENNIPVVTSDFALFWFDYQAGFEVIFTELGWNNSRTKEIALCRGAADAHDKDWGTIITWTYQHPPYIGSAPETYQDMVMSYESGAKYILVFDYPQYPENNPYGILNDDYFSAMQQFWDYTNTHPRNLTQTQAEAAMVLPKDYGWGMRNPYDNIWGLWQPDNASALIWNNMNTLVDRYGLKLDIVYDNADINYTKRYAEVYLWNQTIT